MSMDEELREHLVQSLHHLALARDLVRRTGLVDELDQLGWAYGANPNGYFEVEAYDFQLNAMLKLFSTGLVGHVHLLSGDSEEWQNWMPLDAMLPLPEDERFDLAFSIQLQGDEREVRKWRHFVRWLQPTALLLTDVTSEDANFVWIIWEPMIDEIMNAWETLLNIWEVCNFYDHVGDAGAWKKCRGEIGSDNAARLISEPRNHGEGRHALPDRGVASTAAIARPVDGFAATPAASVTSPYTSRTA